MPIRTLAELAAPDDRTTHFTPFGLGSMGADDAATYQQHAIAGANLVGAVPDDTRRAYERLRTVYAHGILCYEVFTIVHDQVPLLLELALGERLVALYAGVIPLHKGEVNKPFAARRFDEVRQALTEPKGEFTNCSLRLCDGSSLNGFRGYLGDLFAWARREKLLHGQRNRRIEQLLVEIRNDVAHPAGDHLVGPPDTARLMWDVAQVINRLWGSYTPGGRLYPAPLDRYVFAIAWAKVGDRGVTWGRAETLADTVTPWPEDHRYVLVRAAEHEHLADFATTFESTAYPCDFLWGPGSRDAAKEWYSSNAPGSDTVDDYLDRWFVVRHDEGGDPELPLRPTAFLGIPKGQRHGTWHLVQADFPNDAYTHRRHGPTGGSGELSRACALCHATAGVSGGWGLIARELTRLLPNLDAETPPTIDVGKLWRHGPTTDEHAVHGGAAR
jgi:hypothetical protein